MHTWDWYIFLGYSSSRFGSDKYVTLTALSVSIFEHALPLGLLVTSDVVSVTELAVNTF